MRVFELTPKYMGNPAVDFYKWSGSNSIPLSLSESATTSAAAVKKMSRTISNYSPGKVKGAQLSLYDGGHSENLGAFALISRGVKNVIIVDAAHDPDYKFEEYTNLKNILKEKNNITLYVEDIEEFLKNPQKKNGRRLFSKSSVSEGKAVSDNFTSTIYFIKMSRPETIFSGRFSDKGAIERGKALIETRNSLEKRIKKRQHVDCSNIDLKFGNSLREYPDMFTYLVREYTEDPYKHWFWGSFGWLIPAWRYNFPQTTTFDQTFYPVQMEAFIGLGYLEALEMNNISTRRK